MTQSNALAAQQRIVFNDYIYSSGQITQNNCGK